MASAHPELREGEVAEANPSIIQTEEVPSVVIEISQENLNLEVGSETDSTTTSAPVEQEEEENNAEGTTTTSEEASSTTDLVSPETLRWFPNFWRTQTAQYAQIWVKHARVYEQLAKDITDFQQYVGEDVFKRLETARRGGDLNIAMVYKAFVELNQFEQRIIRGKGEASQRLIAFDYDGLLEGWQMLSHQLCSSIPKTEANTNPDSFYYNLVQYKTYFDEARTNRIRVIKVLESHSRQQIGNIKKILNIYLRILGLEEEQIAELGTTAPNPAISPARDTSALKAATRPQDNHIDLTDPKNTSASEDSIRSHMSVILKNDNEELGLFCLKRNTEGEFVALDSDLVRHATSVMIYLAEYGLSQQDHKSLWSLLNQLTNLEELVLDWMNPRGKLPLSHIAYILQMVHPGHLRRISVDCPCWEDTHSAERLGGVVAGFPRCVEFRCSMIDQEATFDEYSHMFRIFQQSQGDDGSPSERLSLTRQTKVKNKTYNIHHIRYDAHDAELVPWVIRSHRLHGQQSITGDNVISSSATGKLITLRLDFPDRGVEDQKKFVPPLIELLQQQQQSSLQSLEIYNVRSTEDFLDPILREGVEQSKHLTSFVLHTQEPHKQVMAQHAPYLKEFLQKNVYLERMDVQGSGFSLDLEWEDYRALYLRLNRFGRRHLHSEDATLGQLVNVLHNARNDPTALYCFLSHKPSLWSSTYCDQSSSGFSCSEVSSDVSLEEEKRLLDELEIELEDLLLSLDII